MTAPASEAGALPAWPRPASLPPLGPGEVHVWAASLDRSARSGEERRRLRRGLLRAILSSYAGCDPQRLEVRPAAGGKPELVPAPGAAPLEFNCSSSGELAVYAVAHGLRVGVDVERVRAVREPLELARAVLTERDRAALAALPGARRHEAFLQRWTETEAHLKGRGDGLAGLGAAAAGGTWSTRPLRLGGGYVGAVAAEDLGWRLRCWRW
jgi:4'-phosphopantetheinyl transferase